METWLIALAALAAAFWWVMKQGKNPAPSAGDRVPKINGPGNFSVEVVGESFYTPAFEAITGKLAYTEEEMFGDAVLTLTDDNPHDKFAVGVSVQGRQVGHLSRKMAREFRQALRTSGYAGLKQVAVPCRVYCGGQDGVFSVTLDLPEAET